MAETCINENFRLLSYASGSLSLTLNLLLLLLILFRTTADLRIYSRVLLSNCTIDLLFTCLAYVIDLHMTVRDGVAVYVIGGFFADTSLASKFALSVVYFFGLYLSVFAVTPPFVYRYFLVCRQVITHYPVTVECRKHVMSRKRFFLLLMLEALLTSLLMVFLWLACWPTAKKTASELSESGNVCADPGHIPYFHIQEAQSLRIASLLLCGATLIILNYSVIVYCNYKIMKVLSASSKAMAHVTFGKRQRSLNEQMNRVLVLQAATPLFVAVVPMLGCLSMLLFSIDNATLLLESVTTVVSFVPVLNALYTILCVSAYRRALTSCCTRMNAIQASSDTSDVVLTNGDFRTTTVP